MTNAQTVSRFEISFASGLSFGIYEASSAEEAIEVCVKDAGYESVAEMESRLGEPSELVATLVASSSETDHKEAIRTALKK